MKTTQIPIEEIKFRASIIGQDAMTVLNNFLTNYPQFEDWSGSHNKMLHHYGRGGLARHTCEVMALGLNVRQILRKETEIDSTTYFFAALFHDSGKMYDYTHVGEGFNDWEVRPHRRLIHHLPRSAIIWHDTIIKFPELNLEYHDDVLHAILAHHGKREAGSPVAPKSHIAWLLHLCDGLSARMDDAETLDVVKAR